MSVGSSRRLLQSAGWRVRRGLRQRPRRWPRARFATDGKAHGVSDKAYRAYTHRGIGAATEPVRRSPRAGPRFGRRRGRWRRRRRPRRKRQRVPRRPPAGVAAAAAIV
ncbi:MAG: hypothetical protein MZW92_30145 [Comamonadaceae bacterium]|nr:hypothetical protein [Comamonadaceae bacterium]